MDRFSKDPLSEQSLSLTLPLEVTRNAGLYPFMAPPLEGLAFAGFSSLGLLRWSISRMTCSLAKKVITCVQAIHRLPRLLSALELRLR